MTIRKLNDLSELRALANDELRSCIGKQGYRTIEKAGKVAQIMATRHGEDFEGYKCRHCQWCHVGHLRKGVELSVNGEPVKLKSGHSVTLTIGKDGHVTINQEVVA